MKKFDDRSDKDNKGIRIIKRNDTRMNLNEEEKQGIEINLQFF